MYVYRLVVVIFFIFVSAPKDTQLYERAFCVCDTIIGE